MSWLYFLLAGAAAGIVSGMGMGGGTILIPILTIFLDVEQHTAQGVNMLAFLPGAALALFVHQKNHNLETKAGWPVLAYGVLGAVGGAFLATALDATFLRRAFGVFLIILAILQWKRSATKNSTTNK